MTTLDVRPQVVDLHGYAGDTLTVRVTAPWALTQGKEWKAQVRSTRESATVSATFTITPPAVDGDPAFVVLPAAVSAGLAGAAVQRRITREGVALMITQFVGVWDVQIAAPGGLDPVNTLAQGNLTLDVDVTRLQ